jgi:hypothetical protein
MGPRIFASEEWAERRKHLLVQRQVLPSRAIR